MPKLTLHLIHRYGKFEDAIPEGFYGARSVQIFDIGWYELVDHDAIARRENDSDSDSEISDDGDSHRVDPGKGDLDVGRPGVYNIHAHERVLKKQWDRFLPTGGSNGGKLHGGEVNTEGFLWMIKKKIGPNLPHGPAAELCERKNTLWSVLTGRTVPEIIAQEAANWEKIRRSEIFRGMHVDGSLRKGEEEEEARMWVDYEREEALLAAGHGEHGSGASSPASSATPSRGVSRSPGSRSISSSPNVPGQGHRLAGPPPQQSERSLASPASLQLIPHGKRKKSTKVQIRPENDYNTEDSEPEREKRKAAKMGR